MSYVAPKVRPIPTKWTIDNLSKALCVTGNSKTSIAWDMEAVATCPGRSGGCQSKSVLSNGKESKDIKCYALRCNYRFGQKLYAQNKVLLIEAQKAGMSDNSIARAIFEAIKRANGYSKTPWIRFHGSGDIWSTWYANILALVAKFLKQDSKQAYMYTRSAVIPTLLPAIIKLAEIVDINLSADYDNWEETVSVYTSCPGKFRRIACMQSDKADWMFKMLEYGVKKHQIIGFPEHSGGLKTAPLKGLPTCPALLKVLMSDESGAACQKCKAICHA